MIVARGVYFETPTKEAFPLPPALSERLRFFTFPRRTALAFTRSTTCLCR